MDVPQRDRILLHLREHPGVSTRLIAKTLDLDASTADYHLRRLERDRRAAPEVVGREVCWFPTGAGFCPILRRAIPLLRRPEARAVAWALTDEHACATTLARNAGVKPITARAVSSKLAALGLVDRSSQRKLRRAAGADVCLARASSGASCDRWGVCPVSRAYVERARGEDTPTSSR